MHRCVARLRFSMSCSQRRPSAGNCLCSACCPWCPFPPTWAGGLSVRSCSVCEDLCWCPSNAAEAFFGGAVWCHRLGGVLVMSVIALGCRVHRAGLGVWTGPRPMIAIHRALRKNGTVKCWQSLKAAIPASLPINLLPDTNWWLSICGLLTRRTGSSVKLVLPKVKLKPSWAVLADRQLEPGSLLQAVPGRTDLGGCTLLLFTAVPASRNTQYGALWVFCVFSNAARASPPCIIFLNTSVFSREGSDHHHCWGHQGAQASACCPDVEIAAICSPFLCSATLWF